MTIPSNLQVGDRFTMGEWVGEPIRWRVLYVTDPILPYKKAVVITERAIDCRPYHESKADVTWEKCSLREFLNGFFYDEAFTQVEKEHIVEAGVSYPENPEASPQERVVIKDKVHCLSAFEAQWMFRGDFDRIAQPSKFAEWKGANPCDGTGNCYWWLRSPGRSQSDAAFVSSSGYISLRGIPVYDETVAVRPAMWITFG